MKKELDQIIIRNKEILSGVPVFSGTRVPVQTLLDYIEAGDSIDEFLEDFPTVKKTQVLKLLEILKEALIEIQN